MKDIVTAVVCPVFNETQTWHEICKSLTDMFDLVVVVDDGSTDPVDASCVPGIIVITHSRNLGKGAALETGFRYCLARGAQVVGTIDSDGEHDPRCLENPTDLLGTAGMVSFSREPIFDGYSFARRWRNVSISKRLSNELGVKLKDTQSGLRLFSGKALQCALQSDMPPGYAVETLMLRSIAAAGFEVREVDIAYPGTPRPEKRFYNPHALWSDLFVLTSTLLGRGAARSKARRPAMPKQLTPSKLELVHEHQKQQ